jgi:hypothetical protein
MTVERLRREGTQLIDMTDIYGAPVQTNRQMFAYFNYLSDQFYAAEVRDRRIINATEGGILHGPRVTVMPLRQCIEEYMQQPLDVWGILQRAHAAGQQVDLPRAQREVEQMLSELRSAEESCARGVVFVERTIRAIQQADGSATSEAEIAEQFQRMTTLRDKLLRRQELARIVEMANHAGVFAFTQGVQQLSRAEAGEGHSGKLRACYHYHTLYASTGEAIARLIPLFEHCRDAVAARLAPREAVAV